MGAGRLAAARAVHEALRRSKLGGMRAAGWLPRISFNCIIQEGVIPDWLRPQLKAALAQISSSLLGGSPELVEVEFTVIPHGFCFRGGEISTTSMVRGSIPPGCKQMVRVDIMQRICDVWRDLTGCAADELVVSVRDRSQPPP